MNLTIYFFPLLLPSSSPIDEEGLGPPPRELGDHHHPLSTFITHTAVNIL